MFNDSVTGRSEIAARMEGDLRSDGRSPFQTACELSATALLANMLSSKQQQNHEGGEPRKWISLISLKP